jgi:cell division protein FtsI (penicillin-binding protein 3)
VGAVQVGQRLGKELYGSYLQAYGFGEPTGIGLAGEQSGVLRPVSTWGLIHLATMSYGYGVSTSLFQMARAYTIFASDGKSLPATLIKNGQIPAGVPVISPQNAQAMRHMLNLAAGPGGTAQKAQTMGYSVGGKTGTAHKQEGKGYAGKKYRGVFVGMAPIEKPRIVVAVMIDEPSNGRYYGGDVAAPVFSQTVQQSLRLMGVQPDMSVKPQIVANAVEESF